MVSQNLEACLFTTRDRFLDWPFSPSGDNPLVWLTGFQGSSAFCLVTMDGAFLLTDSRYVDEAVYMLQGSALTVCNIREISLEDLIRQHQPQGGRIAYDAWCTAWSEQEKRSQALKNSWTWVPRACHFKGLCSFEGDAQEKERETATLQGEVVNYPLAFAGEPMVSKFARVREEMKQGTALFISSKSALSWLFNIRQSSGEFTPYVPGYALLPDEGPCTLWCHLESVSEVVCQDAKGVCHLYDLGKFEATFPTALKGRALLFDGEETPVAAIHIAQDAGIRVAKRSSPIKPLMIIKNATEIAQITSGHITDALALVEVFSWLDASIAQGTLLHEWDVACKIEDVRARNATYWGPSFQSIVAVSPHGGFVHYRPTQEKAAPLRLGDVVLIDTGAQYNTGCTTDVTRTIALGDQPTHKQKLTFTCVLKGFIALASQEFPEGTKGVQLDALARRFLWNSGLDYAHATGHGVGSFGGVHAPPYIGPRDDGIPLQASMVLTNEPGCYYPQSFGVRLENMMITEEVRSGWLRFRQLTLLPIDRRLMLEEELTKSEKKWINNYHHMIFATLTSYIENKNIKNWVRDKTRPIAE
jgi:Xaa-Pro aminopeptidase